MEREGIERPKFSFGAELELSDVDRSVDIPKELGSWEGPKIAGYYMGSELDIVNTKGKFRGVATDPLCLTCQVGGEIHVNPTYTVESQMYRIMRIFDLFSQVGVACPNHGHIHVAIPGLKEDFRKFKNFCLYFVKYERDIFKVCCGYDEDDREKILDSDLPKEVKDYLLYGDAKINSDSLYDEIRSCTSTKEILEVLKNSSVVNYDWVTGDEEDVPGSHRTCVNLYNLVKGDTIEFRVFRASINPVEIYSSLRFVEATVTEALKDGNLEDKVNIYQILHECGKCYRFAPLNFDAELADSWWKTRQTKGRCGCLKKYSGCLAPSEDTITTHEREMTQADQGYETLTELCDWDWRGYSILDAIGLPAKK